MKPIISNNAPEANREELEKRATKRITRRIMPFLIYLSCSAMLAAILILTVKHSTKGQNHPQ